MVAARLVFIGVGPTAVLDPGPGTDLAGRRPDSRRHRGGGPGAAAARLEPGDDLHATGAYRRRVAATLARRTLATAVARATEAGS